MIKLSGGGTGGGREQLSPGPGPPPPVTPAEQDEPSDNNGTETKRVGNFVTSGTEATMSFVLQLGSVEETPEESGNNSPLLLTQEISVPLTIGTAIPKPVIVTNNKTQSLQNLKAVNTSSLTLPCSTVSSSSLSSVKPVTVTYPVNKTSRDIQRIAGSQTNTTQVLTTRMISQKLPPTYQMHPTSIPISASSHAIHLPIKSSLSSTSSSGSVPSIYSLQAPPNCPPNVTQQQTKVQATSDAPQNKQQSATITNLQSNVHQKLQASTQQILNTSVVKAITTATSMPNIQRIHVKAQNMGGQSQTVNLQKVKAMANVNNQSCGGGGGVVVQRNSVTRIQSVQKSQVLTSSTQGTQITMNQVMSNANMQRVQQVNPTNLQKGQTTNVTNVQKMQQVFNNQKTQPQAVNSSSPGHANIKAQQQQQQHSGNQQTLHKMQGLSQKTLAVQRQQQQQQQQQQTVALVSPRVEQQQQQQQQHRQVDSDLGSVIFDEGATNSTNFC